MAIEEEFSIEIPDKEADAIHSGMVELVCLDECARTNVPYSRASSFIHPQPARW
jgi:hypothetical protein